MVLERLLLVDTHAHLGDPVFDPDRAAVLARARTAGVGAVVAVGETAADARRNLALADEFPGVVQPAAGLFPTHLDPAAAEELCDLIRRERHRFVAVGEVGLDHWKVHDPGERALQREIFGRFVDLAVELDLPLNVHSRAAGADTIAFLRERGARRVQLHAFDGRAASALPGVEAGFFFSVPPSVVRSPQKQKLVRRLPLERLLLETDSPVLGADPAARNEPAAAADSLAAIAELQGVLPAAVARATTAGTARLYGPRVAAAFAVRPAVSPADRERVRALRTRVFVEEQACPPQEEFDAHEEGSRHLLAWAAGEAVGCARWRAVGGDGAVAKLERFAVLPERRGAGLGRLLVEDVAADARRAGHRRFVLHAQAHLEGFYRDLGFHSSGDRFVEAGIPHVKMAREEDID